MDDDNWENWHIEPMRVRVPHQVSGVPRYYCPESLDQHVEAMMQVCTKTLEALGHRPQRVPLPRDSVPVLEPPVPALGSDVAEGINGPYLDVASTGEVIGS